MRIILASKIIFVSVSSPSQCTGSALQVKRTCSSGNDSSVYNLFLRLFTDGADAVSSSNLFQVLFFVISMSRLWFGRDVSLVKSVLKCTVHCLITV